MSEETKTEVLASTSNLSFITITGADEKTDVSVLAPLEAEIGLLYSPSPNRGNRHPRREWIQEATSFLPRVAVHICGGQARRELLSPGLAALLQHVQRVQINGGFSVEEVQKICRHYPEHTIITQHHAKNQHLLKVRADNHAVLVDGSGGQGASPVAWVPPVTRKQVGFAGGLGPDNIATEKQKVASIAHGPWWMDMEGKLRVDDWFSCDLAVQAVTAFHAAGLG